MVYTTAPDRIHVLAPGDTRTLNAVPPGLPLDLAELLEDKQRLSRPRLPLPSGPGVVCIEENASVSWPIGSARTIEGYRLSSWTLCEITVRRMTEVNVEGDSTSNINKA
ncbi:unnamed protein product [Amoebophrya sp. A25]|nr:unnamed protein product [Amoebophrya sp. A25]|eukprot:GSA25T00021553001.1